MLEVKYVTFSGTGSWTFVTGFRLRLYKSNRNQLSGLPSLPLIYGVVIYPTAVYASCDIGLVYPTVVYARSISLLAYPMAMNTKSLLVYPNFN